MEYLVETSSKFSENTTERTTSFYDGALQNSSHLPYYSSDTESEPVLPVWWKLFDEKYLRHSFEWTAILITAYLFILVVGVIGNIMVILVIYSRPKMRSVTNIFILNLAVADLFVILFCVPATLLSNLFAPWMLGSFMCKGVAYVQGVSVVASAYSLAAISFDRCKAIYKSHGRSNGLSRHQGFLTIFLIWITAIVLTIPWAIIFEVTETESSGISYCVETWSNDLLGKLYFLITNFLLGYCFPLLLISVTNFIIWCHVNNRKVPRGSDSSGSITRMHRKARHGVVKMLGVVTLVFLLSWLPLHVLVMRIKFAGENISDYEYNLHGILLPFAQWLGSWNSSANPILYAFLNKKFRKMFRSLLPSWMPFSRETGKSFITRGVLTSVTFSRGILGDQSRTSIYTSRSSKRESKKGSTNSVLERRRFVRKESALSISAANATWNTRRYETNDIITELSTSSVRSVVNTNLESGVAIIHSTVVVLADIGNVTNI